MSLVSLGTGKQATLHHSFENRGKNCCGCKEPLQAENKGNKYMKTCANDSVLQSGQRNIPREVKVKVGGQE